MNQKRIFWMVLLLLVASLDMSLIRNLQQNGGEYQEQSQLLEEEEALAQLRAFGLPQDAFVSLTGQKKKKGSVMEKTNDWDADGLTEDVGDQVESTEKEHEADEGNADEDAEREGESNVLEEEAGVDGSNIQEDLEEEGIANESSIRERMEDGSSMYESMEEEAGIDGNSVQEDLEDESSMHKGMEDGSSMQEDLEDKGIENEGSIHERMEDGSSVYEGMEEENSVYDLEDKSSVHEDAEDSAYKDVKDESESSVHKDAEDENESSIMEDEGQKINGSDSKEGILGKDNQSEDIKYRVNNTQEEDDADVSWKFSFGFQLDLNQQKQMMENILAYLFCQTLDADQLEQWKETEQEAAPKLYEDYTNYVQNLLADAVYFPVPEASNDAQATVSYENSWQSERTYGGARGHEGCDLMASVQQRGYYPVISVSDGVVEKIGWLPQGGYRIGIRSRHGVYYYYAHLAEYEDGMAEGVSVAAGQLIGYMGDTGYSEVEGTTGNFPVHLHFGMYLDLEGRGEVSFNPYYLLGLLENHKLRYMYEK